jgi:hypothetical protein
VVRIAPRQALTAVMVAASCASDGAGPEEAVIGAAVQANLWIAVFPAAAFPWVMSSLSAAAVRRALWNGDAAKAHVRCGGRFVGWCCGWFPRGTRETSGLAFGASVCSGADLFACRA